MAAGSCYFTAQIHHYRKQAPQHGAWHRDPALVRFTMQVLKACLGRGQNREKTTMTEPVIIEDRCHGPLAPAAFAIAVNGGALGCLLLLLKRNLAVGTSMSPEIAEYPDSEKVGVLAEFPAQGDGKPTVMRYIIRDQAGMAEYSEGE
jgi:hypothetical protein